MFVRFCVFPTLLENRYVIDILFSFLGIDGISNDQTTIGVLKLDILSKKIVLLVFDQRTWNSIIGYSILIGYSSSWTTITYTNSNSISWNWLIYFHRTKNIAQFLFAFLPFLLTVLRKYNRASFRQNIHVIFWNFCNNVCSVKKDTKHSIVLLLRLVSFFSERTLKSGWNDIKPVSIWKNRISVLVVTGHRPKTSGSRGSRWKF